MKIKVATAVLAALASAVVAPATADAAVRPAVSGICGYNLAIFPGYDSSGPTANVSGTITFCGSSTATPAYLVLWKTSAAGVRTDLFDCVAPWRPWCVSVTGSCYFGCFVGDVVAPAGRRSWPRAAAAARILT
jgi:hypothetical protein